MKQKEKRDRLQASRKKRLVRIAVKDAAKMLKHAVKKEGKDWVIRDGREIRNPKKADAIRDWLTLNGYLVE